MLNRNINVAIGAKDEFTDTLARFQASAETATEKVVKSLNEAEKATKKTSEASSKIKESMETFGKAADYISNLYEKIEPIGKAYEGLFKGAKNLDVSYSDTVDEFLGKITTAGEGLSGFLSGQGPAKEESVRAEAAAQGVEGALNSCMPNEAEGALNQVSQQGAQATIKETDKAQEKQKENDEQYRAKGLKREQEFWDSKVSMAGRGAGAMANIMQNLYKMTGSKHKAMFEAMKVFAIAETIIQTYRAAQGAYAAMAKIHPALGVAAAAAAMAAGMARIKAIKDTRPAGASATISAGGTAHPEDRGGSPDAYPVPQRFEEERGPAQHITVHIYNPLADENWERMVEDNIAPALEKLSEDRNVELNIRTVEQ